MLKAWQGSLEHANCSQMKVYFYWTQKGMLMTSFKGQVKWNSHLLLVLSNKGTSGLPINADFDQPQTKAKHICKIAGMI